MLRSAEKSESGRTDIDLSGWINIEAMHGIESRVHRKAWIIAKDSVVDFLVLESFSETTLQNLQRGVNYRFLVSKAKAKEMEDFVADISKELACISSGKPGSLSVHTLPDASMKLTMPGCLFDPADLTHAASYFRACGTDGDKITFHWVRLSPAQHTAYLEGFKFAWPPERAERLAAAKALAPLSAGAAVLIGLSSWIITRLTPFDSRKEAVWAALATFSLWIGATWALVETKKSLQILRHTKEFHILQTTLQILFGAILLGLAVNLLSDWLGSSE
jgi:hypothetical protein